MFPLLPIAIIAALAFLGDRAMEFALTKAQVIGVVVFVSLLVLLILVLLISIQRKPKNQKGGPENTDE